MDSPTPRLRPATVGSIADLPLPPLSEAADEAIRRGRAFLFGMSQGGFWMKGILHGYTESTHLHGVYLFSIATGERGFDEWREWRALRPPRDPDLPELVTRLEAFFKRWEAIALECASLIEDEDDRKEVRFYIHDEEPRASRTWTAKAFVQRLRGLNGVALYRPVWDALVARGVLGELPDFDAALAEIQDFIRTSPLDEAELADIQRARESAAVDLRSWLTDREKELAAVLEPAEGVLLGLGDQVPPPFEGRSAFLLQKIEIAAKA